MYGLSIQISCVPLLVLAACTHADELDQLRRDRNEATQALDCVTLEAPPAMRVGPLHDDDPSSAAIEVALPLRIAPHCTATRLSVGLCTVLASSGTLEPASWASELDVVPGESYRPLVAIPEKAGRHVPCVRLEKVYAYEVERVCEGAEALCPSDGVCRTDTKENPARCGERCEVCPGGAYGAPACVEGRCTLRCDEGYRLEAGQCRARPACKGLERACNGDDCCAVDRIAASDDKPIEFTRGYDKSESRDGLPEWQAANSSRVVVEPYYLDRYEVTVARFRRFVDAYEAWRIAGNPRASHGRHLRVPNSGWADDWRVVGAVQEGGTTQRILPSSRAELIASLTQPSCAGFASFTQMPGPNDDLPINCVNFYLAYLYCMWDGDSVGSRLPTEAEWNAAASGGAQQRAYPWSNPPESLVGVERVLTSPANRVPFSVGRSEDRGLFNTADLAGGVAEWVRDTGVLGQPYPFAYVEQTTNPIELRDDPFTPTPRVVRGGSFRDHGAPARMRSAARKVQGPMQVGSDLGFRCARSYP